MALSTDQILAQLAGAGINLSATPSAAGQEDAGYEINGQMYYTNSGQQQYQGGAGTTGAAQGLLASLTDPYMNDQAKAKALADYQSGNYDTYNTTKGQNESYADYHARQNAAAAANPTGGSGAPTGVAAGSLTGPTAAQDSSNRNALALINQTLSQYGLPSSLSDWAWQEIVGGKGSSEVMLDLQQRPEYKQAFPEIDARLKAGLAPLAPGDIISYRQQARQLMRNAGLPEGYYDSPEDFTKFIVNDMSLSELSSRVTTAANAAFKMPVEDRAALAAFGVGPGELTAFWLDPDKAQPLLEQKYAAAQLSGAATRSGYGALNESEATALTQQGVSATQAQTGFGQLASSSELFNPLDNSDETIGRQDQMDAVFGGNANAQRRIEQQRRRRQATFEGGGGFAAAQTGVSGLGQASRT